MIRLLLLVFTLVPALVHAQQPAYTASFNALLRAVRADDGRVHYDRLARGPERARLDNLLGVLAAYPLGSLTSDPARLAFWSNAYNLLMLDAVARQPQRRDVLGSDGGAVFFKTPRSVGGLRVTLDEIENVILRRQDGPRALAPHRVQQVDPRLHVALNCAAVSCPVLRPVALTPANLDAQLEAGMRQFVGSPRHFAVDGSTVRLSALLDWFGQDFDRFVPAGDYLLRYLHPDRPGAAQLQDVLRGRTSADLRRLSQGTSPTVAYFYDWTVNRAGGR